MKPLRHRPSNPLVVSLFVVLFCLVSPLLAKCPADFVKIKGRIDCFFEPDDKVFVTLIFSSLQREGSGVETAIDIHEATFSGRLTFDTYSSSFLTGDRCYRRPKSVLIRLIAADGFEKDRTSLKIASDFNFDEEHGEYMLKSDVILHGWCQAKPSAR